MDLKPELNQLSGGEKDALIEALWARLDALEAENQRLQDQVKQLQGQQAKTSRNSHQPPSSDGLKKPKPKSRREHSGKAPGGQKGHRGYRLEAVANPQHTVRHPVVACQRCQHELSAQPVAELERRQVFELPPLQIEVTEHQAEVKVCPACGHTNRGVFPAAVEQPTQYGARLQALGVYLNGYQLLPYERIGELFADVFGHRLSAGSLVEFNRRCHERLAPVEQAIKAQLVAEPVVHFDESGLRIEGRRQWLHVASTAALTAYQAHPKRGGEALEAMAILPHFHGTSVHDHWQPYFGYACQHSLCNAHHLRELAFIHDYYEQPWAGQLSACLVQMKQVVDEAKAHGHTALSSAALQRLDAQYEAILAAGAEQVPPPPPPVDGKRRGRRKQSPAKNLLDRLSEHKASVVAFLYDFQVPFDNNQAERDVRMVKVQQKISGTFRSAEGAQRFCRIRGYLSTMRKNACSVMQALQSVFQGQPLLPTVLAQPLP